VFQEKVLKLEEHSTTDSQTKLLQITTLEATVQELKADKAAVSQQLEESQTSSRHWPSNNNWIVLPQSYSSAKSITINRLPNSDREYKRLTRRRRL
jgi:hypothetical protein